MTRPFHRQPAHSRNGRSLTIRLAALAFGTLAAVACLPAVAAPEKAARKPASATTIKQAKPSKAVSPAKPGKAPTQPPQAAPELADKQADLQEIRGRIDNLRKELATSEEHKNSAADRLRESERQISLLQRTLDALAAQRNQLQLKLRELNRQTHDLEGTLGQQQTQLEQLIYRQYLQGRPDSLQLLLNGGNPNQMARDIHYLSAIAHSRADLLDEIRGNLQRKKALTNDARDRADELTEVEAEQKERASQLTQQREQRALLLAQLSDKVSAQRKEIGNLQADEKRMSQLIDRLTKLIAAQQAEQAARAAKAKAAAEREAARQAAAKEAAREAERHAARTPTTKSGERPSEKPMERPPEKPVEIARPRQPEAENTLEPMANSGAFERQRGNLRLPAQGTVAGRFGTPREGGGTWKGLFIKAAHGGSVKAIANGKIVFADWMRGFGNLIIVDHGDGYLSIYGNNDALHKRVGDTVKGGDNIAAVGNSGGNPESGLYFELRHQGQPIDPMKWASLK